MSSTLAGKAEPDFPKPPKSETESPSPKTESQRLVSPASKETNNAFPINFGGYLDVVIALIACIGALSLGMVLGYSNPALQDPALLHVLDDDERKTWFASLVAIGAIFGGPCAGFLVVLIGRKWTLMLCNLPMGLGWFTVILGGIGLKQSHVVLYFGRIMTGLGTGMVSLSVPLYIAEIANKNRRGLLGAGFQLFASTGILLSYVIGVPLSWDWLAVVCLATSTVNVLLLLTVPESPRWFIANKRREEALEVLGRLAGKDADVSEEYNEIQRSLGAQSAGGVKLREFTSPTIYKPSLISFGMMVFQQMSGINTVIFYSSEIFASSGFADDPKLPTIIIGTVLVAATVVACVLMDKTGRRVLFLVSGTFMTFSITILGLYFYLTEVQQMTNLNWLSLASVLLYVIAFSVGWGPIPWISIAEIVPTKVRGVVIGMATCICWLLMFVTTKFFESLKLLLNNHGAFWFFGGWCLLSCFFVGFFVPETKGRSLEEIQEGFALVPRGEKGKGSDERDGTNGAVSDSGV